jgi:ATP-dependent protease ClpP protease subunit
MSRRTLPRLWAQGDPDEPYGDVEYADPGYQEDGKKRYPIDTEEHVRAAWSYINQEDNAAKYTPEQLSKIKSRIKRAAKKFGIEIAADRLENLKVTRPLSRLEKGQTDWYRVQNSAGATPEIYIYDEIGYWGTASNAFVKDLSMLAASDQLIINMNSPGGDVFDGIAIYQALLDHPAEIVVKINGLAASIASVIAMAGDRVIMGAKSSIMIHEGFTFASGDAATMRKTADMLDRVSNNIASVYADRAGGEASVWRDRMREETWYNAEEALAAGLADEIEGRRPIPSAPEAFDLSVYKYSGRAEAPGPARTELKGEHGPEVLDLKNEGSVIEPKEEPKAEPEFKWDFAAFQSSLKEGIRG